MKRNLIFHSVLPFTEFVWFSSLWVIWRMTEEKKCDYICESEHERERERGREMTRNAMFILDDVISFDLFIILESPIQKSQAMFVSCVALFLLTHCTTTQLCHDNNHFSAILIKYASHATHFLFLVYFVVSCSLLAAKQKHNNRSLDLITFAYITIFTKSLETILHVFFSMSDFFPWAILWYYFDTKIKLTYKVKEDGFYSLDMDWSSG